MRKTKAKGSKKQKPQAPNSLPFHAEETDRGHVVAETIEPLFQSSSKPIFADSNLPIYLVNIPLNAADPKLNPVELLYKIRDEIFYSSDLNPLNRDQALRRISVVIGINRRKSLLNNDSLLALTDAEKEKINALPFPVFIMQFLWQPSFSFSQEGLQKINAEYLNSFQMAKSWCDENPQAQAEVVTFEKEKISSKMVPYGEIRNTIASYYQTQQAGFQLRQRFKRSTLYFLMLDADLQSLILKNELGLLHYFENRLADDLKDRNPSLFAGGFRIDPAEGFMQSEAANLVLDIQHKMAAILPLGIYYSETNCLISLPPNTNSLLERFSPSKNEMKGLVQHLVQRQNPVFIFDSEAAIRTTLPARMKKEFCGYEDSGKFVGWNLTDISHLRGISQSILKPLSWAHAIYDALPKLNNEGKKNVANIRLVASSFLSKLFNLADPFSILENSDDRQNRSHYSVTEKLAEIICTSKAQKELKDFVADEQEFTRLCEQIANIYSPQICQLIIRTLNATREALTKFIDTYFCLDPEENITYMANKEFNGMDKDTLWQHYEDILGKINEKHFTEEYFKSYIFGTLTRMHVLVAFDDFHAIQNILRIKKWKKLPNGSKENGSLTPFALALVRGFVDIAALYLVKMPNLLNELDENTLTVCDQWGRSLLQALGPLDQDGEVFESVLQKYLQDPDFDLPLSDNYGNSVYDDLIEGARCKQVLKLLKTLHKARPHYFTGHHAALLQDLLLDLDGPIANPRQNGISLLDLAILQEDYELCKKLIGDYQEPSKEELDEDNFSHLTTMENCFYLCASQKMWKLLIALLPNSSNRIFYLVNYQGQNVFHLCAQWGSAEDFDKLWIKFSYAITSVDTELEDGQALEYYKNFCPAFQFLLSRLDDEEKSPFTYLVYRFINETQINRDLFTRFLIRENMKSKIPHKDEGQVSDNGVPLLFMQSENFFEEDIEFVIQQCLSLDSEFASAVFKWRDQNVTYLSILIENNFQIPDFLFEKFRWGDLLTEKLTSLIEKLSDADDPKWSDHYIKFTRLYLESVRTCEDIGDDVQADFIEEDGEEIELPDQDDLDFIDDGDDQYSESNESEAPRVYTRSDRFNPLSDSSSGYHESDESSQESESHPKKRGRSPEADDDLPSDLPSAEEAITPEAPQPEPTLPPKPPVKKVQATLSTFWQKPNANTQELAAHSNSRPKGP